MSEIRINNIKLLPYILKIDFLDSGKGSNRKIWGIILSTLFTTGVLSINNFNFFDKKSFIFISATINLLFVSMFIFSDFPNLFFSKKFRDVLFPLPINLKSFYYQKYFSGFIYIFSVIIISNIAPSVFLYFYDNNIFAPFLFIILSTFFASGVILILISANLVVIKISAVKHKFIIYFFQILFIFFIFYINNIALRNLKSDVFANHSVFKLFPQYLIILGFENIVFAIILITISISFFYFSGLLFNLLYENLYDKINKNINPTEKRKYFSIFSFNLSDKIINNDDENAGYFLIQKIFANSSSVKLKIIPVILIPLISAIILFISTGTLVMDISMGATRIFILHPSLSITLIMCLRIIVSTTKVAGGEDKPFNYDVLPFGNMHFFKSGILKFIYLNLYFPLILILFIFVSIIYGFQISALNFLFIIMAVDLLNNILNIFDKVAPFALDAGIYNSSRKFTDILIIAVAGIALIFIQIYVFQNVFFVLLTIFVFIILSNIIKRFLYRNN